MPTALCHSWSPPPGSCSTPCRSREQPAAWLPEAPRRQPAGGGALGGEHGPTTLLRARGACAWALSSRFSQTPRARERVWPEHPRVSPRPETELPPWTTGTLRPESLPRQTGPSRPAPPRLLVWVPAPRATSKGGAVLAGQGRPAGLREPLQEGSRPPAPARPPALQRLEPAGHSLTLPGDGVVAAHRAQARSSHGFKSLSPVSRGVQGLTAGPAPRGGRGAPPHHCVRRVSV